MQSKCTFCQTLIVDKRKSKKGTPKIFCGVKCRAYNNQLNWLLSKRETAKQKADTEISK